MSSIALVNLHSRALELAPGFFVSVIVATAATFLSEHYGAPVMLFALLLGIALNFLSGDGKCKAGIEFTARAVLRLGVALLGMRALGMKTQLKELAAIGIKPILLMVGETVFLVGLVLLLLHWGL